MRRRSCEHLFEFVERDQPTGEERDLFAHVPARLGGAQVPHQVDEVDGVVCFEREDPFVEYLQSLFSENLLDLVIAVGAPAARFVQRCAGGAPC